MYRFDQIFESFILGSIAGARFCSIRCLCSSAPGRHLWGELRLQHHHQGLGMYTQPCCQSGVAFNGKLKRGKLGTVSAAGLASARTQYPHLTPPSATSNWWQLASASFCRPLCWRCCAAWVAETTCYNSPMLHALQHTVNPPGEVVFGYAADLYSQMMMVTCLIEWIRCFRF